MYSIADAGLDMHHPVHASLSARVGNTSLLPYIAAGGLSGDVLFGKPLTTIAQPR